jgi:NADPH2 dehydrogenase
MRMDNPISHFIHIIRDLKDLNLAYLHLMCGNIDSEDRDRINPFVQPWRDSSPVILAGGFKPASAKAALDKVFGGRDVMIALRSSLYFESGFTIYDSSRPEIKPYNRDAFYLPMVSEAHVAYRFSKESESSTGLESIRS